MSPSRCHKGKSLGLLTTVLLAGCQFTGKREPPPLREAKAVICPKCETVWVEGLDLNDPYMMTYRPEKVMKCPDCKSAVESFFTTGKLAHTCETCGGDLKHCTKHRQTIGAQP